MIHHFQCLVQHKGENIIMGKFTEINVCFDLIKDTPKNVSDILKYLIECNEEPTVLPKHEFFNCERWGVVACCDSYYFDGMTNSKIVFDDILKCYKVNIRANLQNYDDEIDKFLHWLVPYIATEGFIGYTRYEEYDVPSLIYIEDDTVVYKNVE